MSKIKMIGTMVLVGLVVFPEAQTMNIFQKSGGPVGFPTANIDSVTFVGIPQAQTMKVFQKSRGTALDFSVANLDSVTFLNGSGACAGGVFTDARDGQSYKCVVIGTQTWMAQNLNYGTKVLGSAGQTNNAVVEKFCFNDADANCTTYGGLYHWAEMMALPSSCYSTDCASQIQSMHKGVCPMGWHVPTDSEWKTLEMYLGLTQIQADANGPRGTIGTKLKSATGWLGTSGNGTDVVGFSALPAGYCEYTGSFSDQGSSAYFWSASQSGAIYAWERHLDSGSAGMSSYITDKDVGFSVRCLQD